MESVCAVFFVYGTLKRGQINHSLIGPDAIRIEAAEIDGRLYDLGDFPALVAGSGHVHGEAIWVEPSRLPSIRAVLDRLEEFIPGRPHDSYYLRRIVDVHIASGEQVQGYAYFYNHEHPSLPSIDRMRPLHAGVWHGPTDATSGTDSMLEYRQHVRGFVAEQSPSG